MSKFSELITVVAILVLTVTHASLLRAQTQGTTPTKFIVLLPERFTGWGCVDFGVASAPPLVREGDTLVVRPRPGQVVQTSDKPTILFFHVQAWVEAGGTRQALPYDLVHREVFGGNSGSSVERYCAFYGTVDEAELAGDPPGFPNPPRENAGVSDQERQALIALYKATDGDHWTHRMGWLGPPGTECKWHGVECWSETHNKPQQVMGLDLAQNNLVGTLPEVIGQLTHFTELNLMENTLEGQVPQSAGKLTHLADLNLLGNHLSGMLSQSLIQQWLAGTLRVVGDASLLTDIAEIEYEVDPSALLCGFHRIQINADGHAVRYETRCRNATPDDRTTYCEVKEGKSWGNEFATLAWVLEKNGFFHLNPEYSGNITDAAFVTTRATTNGKLYSVEEYAFGAPFELSVIQLAVEGFASSAVEWEKTTEQPRCPGAWSMQKD